MRNIIAFLSVLFLSACSCNPQPVAVSNDPPYQYIQGPGGQQMVACYDNSGTRFVLNYLVFQSLMNGPMGYGGVMNYYHTYPTRVMILNSSYDNYRPFSGRSYPRTSWNRSYTRPTSTYRPTTPSTYRPTTPSRPSPSRAYTPARSSWKPTGRSSPRSTPGRSSFRSTSSRRR